MLAFEIWGKFASFKDPFTISQNLTFNLPPKTAVGGMMASLLGLPYQTEKDDIAYFDEVDFFDFQYSCIVFQRHI